MVENGLVWIWDVFFVALRESNGIIWVGENSLAASENASEFFPRNPVIYTGCTRGQSVCPRESSRYAATSYFQGVSLGAKKLKVKSFIHLLRAQTRGFIFEKLRMLSTRTWFKIPRLLRGHTSNIFFTQSRISHLHTIFFETSRICKFFLLIYFSNN